MNLESICAKEFGYFCACILKQQTGKMHVEWIDHIMNNPKHLSIVAPRGHLKTTILSVCFPLWIMFRSPPATADREVFVVIESASMDQSVEIMRRIKTYIELNEALRSYLMPENIYHTKWSETEIKCKNGNRIKAVPFGDTIRGKHPDYCISDDVLTSDNVEQSKNIYYSAVFPIGQGKNVKHIVVGTPQSFTDLLSDLETKDSFTSLKYPAVITDDEGKWVRPQLPEIFNLDKLRVIKETMPAHLWSREYMCSPISDASAMFPYDTSIKPCIELHYPLLTTEQQEDSQFYMGCDIAMSGSAGADFSVFAIIQKVPGLPLRLADLQRMKGKSSEDLISRVKELNKIYKFSKVLVEKTGIGFGLVNTLENDDDTKMIVEGFDTKRAKKEQILSNLEILLRNKGLKLLQNDVLISELSAFGVKITRDGKYSYEGLGAHDDTVIALALAVSAAGSLGEVDIVGIDRPSADDKMFPNTNADVMMDLPPKGGETDTIILV